MREQREPGGGNIVSAGETRDGGGHEAVEHEAVNCVVEVDVLCVVMRCVAWFFALC